MSGGLPEEEKQVYVDKADEKRKEYEEKVEDSLLWLEMRAA